MKGRWILLIVIISVAMMVATGTILLDGEISTASETPDNRPSHCKEGICIPSSVFKKLPDYPSNFNDVYSMFYPEPFYGIIENFSIHYEDEHYWKQPEFYADTFKRGGIQYYTTNPIRWRAGSGGYPSEQFVSGVDIGETIENTAYYHSSWAIPYYQIFKLEPSFPEYENIKMGTIEVYQDPDEARRCLDVEVTPANIMLEPTLPYFYYNWAQKIKVRTTVKCEGEWMVSLNGADADANVMREQVRILGRNSITTSLAVGEWLIYIDARGEGYE